MTELARVAIVKVSKETFLDATSYPLRRHVTTRCVQLDKHHIVAAPLRRLRRHHRKAGRHRFAPKHTLDDASNVNLVELLTNNVTGGLAAHESKRR